MQVKVANEKYLQCLRNCSGIINGPSLFVETIEGAQNASEAEWQL